jgi:D-threo-aldose 1-dehydrogenase
VDFTSSYRQVGATRFDVPVFGLGTAHLGELFAPVAEPDSRATLDAAWDGGVRFYDTAPWYGRGLSEHRLGGFLRTKKRDAFVVTTKVGRTLHRPKDPRTFDRSPWKGGLNFEVNFDYSYDGIMRSYEQALPRLALDTVDALVIHDLDASFHGDALEGHKRALTDSGMRALGEIKGDGQVKAVGVGINTAEALDTMVREYDVDFALVAMPYTLLDQKSLGGGLATCVERKISVIVGAPFASGILVRGSKSDAAYGYLAAPEAVREKVRRIEAVCDAHGVALPAAALQFPLAHPAVVSIIPGAARATEVTQNLASLAAPIPDAFWSDLKAEGLIESAAPVPAGR